MNKELITILRREPEKSPPRAPSAALLLFPDRLLPFLGCYLARQGLDCKVSESFSDGFRALVLSCRKPTGSLVEPAIRTKPLPGFVLNYLGSLARCHLFTAAGEKAAAKDGKALEKGILVEYGFHLPGGDAIDSGKPEDDFLALVFGSDSRPALVLEPAPEFRYLQLTGRPQPVTLGTRQTLTTDFPGRLEITLKLVDDPRSSPVRALYLQGPEINWLARLSARLPGLLLHRLKWAGNPKEGILLLPEKEGLFLFPFGTPLCRAQENLYLETGRRLSPRLTPDQLNDILNLDAEQLTFLTSDRRLEIAKTAFRPLDHHLLQSQRPAVTLKPAGPEIKFDFDQSLMEALGKESEKAAATGPEEPEKPEKDIQSHNEAAPESPALTVTRNREFRPEPGDEREILRRKGLEQRRAGDLLGAAVCFALAGEEENAAECYRLAALDLESGRPPLVPPGRPEDARE